MQSEGTNKLIKEGAIPVWNGYQIVEELQMFSNEKLKKSCILWKSVIHFATGILHFMQVNL